ncbi:hypothetical protein [Trichocoleus sp. DQ-U1]|uniref:hypothetical protein n=1 Tax=Trichocoleus sp. DQ-U1 TaxID=2933926 RepID=UPI00329993BB
MSMEHKAFVFDYDAFADELGNILENALLTNNNERLVNFIKQNLNFLKDPYEGEALSTSWDTMVEPKDPHQYGDFALTKFYDPQDDIGLGAMWENIQNILKIECGKDFVILGTPFGFKDNYFDPGKMGSYFQSKSQVKGNLQLLTEMLKLKPALFGELNEALKMIRKAAEVEKGFYITF